MTRAAPLAHGKLRGLRAPALSALTAVARAPALTARRIAICAVLVLAISAASTYAADSAEKLLADTVRNTIRRDSLDELLELRRELGKAQRTSRPDVQAVSRAAARALPGLKKIKAALEDVADRIGQDQRTLAAFIPVVLDYYEFAGLLHTAVDAFGAAKLGMTHAAINEMDLVVPAALARTLGQFQSQKSVSLGGEPFDLSFRLRPGGQDKVQLALSVREANRFGRQAFTAFPSEATAKQRLRVQGMRLLFDQHAAINTYVYPEERHDARLKKDADPFLHALQDRSDSLQFEGAFRKFLVQTVMEPASAALSGVRPDFKEELKGFLNRFGKKFLAKLEPTKLARLTKFGATPEMIGTMKKEGALDALAGIFIANLDKTRAPNAFAALTQSHAYLTQLPDAELKAAIAEGLQVAEAGVLYKLLETIAVNAEDDCKTNCLTAEEKRDLVFMIVDFVNISFRAEQLPDSSIEPLKRVIRNPELIVSFRRYQLADMLLTVVDWIDQAELAIRALGDGTRDEYFPVPAAVIGASPDPGKALLALQQARGEEKAPAWVMEMIQLNAAKISDGGPMDDPEKLALAARRTVLETPARLVEIARYVLNKARDGGVRGDIRKLDKNLQGYQPYRWHSTDARLKKLAAASEWTETRAVLLGLSTLGAKADEALASSLRDPIREAFVKLAEKGSTGALETLVKDLERGAAFVESKKSYLLQLLGSGEDRTRVLTGILSNPAVFRAYIALNMKTIQDMFPGLSLRIRLPKDVAETAGITEAVSLYDLVRWVRGGACLPGEACDRGAIAKLGLSDWTFLDDALEGLKTGRINKKSLRTRVPVPFTPADLLTAAASGKQKIKKPSILHAIVEGMLAKNEGPSDDAFWPTQFRVRDILPALYDKRMERDAQGKPQLVDSGSAAKAQRMLVSALLGAYLHSASMANIEAVDRLMNPVDQECVAKNVRSRMMNRARYGTVTDTEVRNIEEQCSEHHLRVLVDSQAYASLTKELGDETSALFDEIKSDATRTRRWIENVKKFTTVSQEYMYFVFIGTLFVPLSPGSHILASSAMILSSAADLAADISQIVDSGFAYSKALPFGQTGFLDKGLLSFSELDKLRKDFEERLEIVVDRAPMDLAWYSGFFYGLLNARTAWTKERQFLNAVDEAFKLFNLPRTATPAEVKAAFRKLSREHHPDKFGTNPNDPRYKEAVEFQQQLNIARANLEEYFKRTAARAEGGSEAGPETPAPNGSAKSEQKRLPPVPKLLGPWKK